jgi:hypothetical protein
MPRNKYGYKPSSKMPQIVTLDSAGESIAAKGYSV